ncbi:uncharacterized protein LOC132262293 [Phlebotomus argentipes]|uniref:uncharacterized protein LOC132262293 n=1 Tax=Phlebotomus argentipes TaxID=94469 RepID=UPI002892FC5D|nr:uncharacterized protein LOC132262293 [Phlebotomus argentipes]
MANLRLFFILLLLTALVHGVYRVRRRERCPKVKAMRNFELAQMMGFWNVVQYFASTEEAPEYSCMRSLFSFSYEDLTVTMNFTYIYADDPLHEVQQGNITWIIPNFAASAHWVHAEDIYEGIYNTYIIDTDYKSWALIMHCAEKTKDPPRYLSALLLSREKHLGINVINFLREKLPRYDIDISFMFPIEQGKCDESGSKSTGLGVKQPMKVIHK